MWVNERKICISVKDVQARENQEKARETSEEKYRHRNAT